MFGPSGAGRAPFEKTFTVQNHALCRLILIQKQPVADGGIGARRNFEIVPFGTHLEAATVHGHHAHRRGLRKRVAVDLLGKKWLPPKRLHKVWGCRFGALTRAGKKLGIVPCHWGLSFIDEGLVEGS